MFTVGRISPFLHYSSTPTSDVQVQYIIDGKCNFSMFNTLLLWSSTIGNSVGPSSQFPLLGIQHPGRWILPDHFIMHHVMKHTTNNKDVLENLNPAMFESTSKRLPSTFHDAKAMLNILSYTLDVRREANRTSDYDLMSCNLIFQILYQFLLLAYRAPQSNWYAWAPIWFSLGNPSAIGRHVQVHNDLYLLCPWQHWKRNKIIYYFEQRFLFLVVLIASST